MEYKHIGQYLKNNLPCESMVTTLLKDIQHLAKRQMTYFRGMERRGLSIHWIGMADLSRSIEVIQRHEITPDILSS